MRKSVLCLCLIYLSACGSKVSTDSDTAEPEDTGTETTKIDEDGDGVSPAEGDCDDDDPDRYPGRPEDCNGRDDDCDDKVDERFPDTDEDGIADCMDEEECDGLDNDGDGTVDEGFDSDTDGIPDCQEVEECNGLDDDADGEIDEDFDLDGDGYTTCDTFPDCDDEDPDASPGATELDDDLKDNDCDGLMDETSWRPGDLVVSEVMVSPLAVEDTRGEWIEITNTTPRTVALNGIRIFSNTGSHLIQRPEWLLLEPGESFVLGLSMNPSVNGGVPVDYAYSGIDLNPEGDTLTVTIEGLILDDIAWDGGESMPSLDGATISLDPTKLDWVENDLAQSWCVAQSAWGEGTDLGSPGEDNDLCGHIDHDGDGLSPDAGDCDDEDADVYPGAPEVDVGVDNDCDGVVASQPVAWADYDLDLSSLSSCDTLQLDGSRSYDPDGDPLSYAWTLVTVPEESVADTSWIVSAEDERPTFTPDAPGDYQFSLTVDDGALVSSPSTLTLTLHEPGILTVDAGPDQLQEDTVSCTSSSCDACPAVVFSLETDLEDHPDVMGFTWSVSSEWVTVGIDDTSSATPYVVVWDLIPEPGESVEAIIDVTLGVGDCLDRTTEDTLTLTYRCTGG